MALFSRLDSISFLKWSQIWKNNSYQWDNSVTIFKNYTTKIKQLNQTINNFYASWEEVVSKKEFSDVLKIIKFIMEQDTNTISKMQWKIKEMDEEIKKLKDFIWKQN